MAKNRFVCILRIEYFRNQDQFDNSNVKYQNPSEKHDLASGSDEIENAV